MQAIRALPMTLALVLVYTLTMPVQAEVYKWIGPDGVVRYGQLPPPGVQAQPVASKATEPEPEGETATPGDPSQAQADAAELERIRAEQAEREAKRQAELEEYCEQARAEIKKLDERSASRLAYQGENGETIRLTQAEYDAHRAQVQAGIDEHCS